MVKNWRLSGKFISSWVIAPQGCLRFFFKRANEAQGMVGNIQKDREQVHDIIKIFKSFHLLACVPYFWILFKNKLACHEADDYVHVSMAA